MRIAPSPAGTPTAAPPGAHGGRAGADRDAWLGLAGGAALFVLAFGLRLWGHAQVVTADDQDWVRRAVDYAQAVDQWDPRNTYQGAHPGVPVLWIASMVISRAQVAELERRDDDRTRLEKSPSYLPVLYRVRQALAGYAAALTVAVAFLAIRLVGRGPGILAGVLLAAEPFLVAHGQIFSTDSLLAMLMAVSALASLVYFDGRGGRRYLLVSGVAAGLAFSTKAPAIVLFGLVPITGALWIVGRRWSSGEAADAPAARPASMRAPLVTLAWDLVLWGAAAGLTYVAVWPALWVDPIATLTRLESGVRGVGESPRRWGNFFLGQVYDDDDVALALWPVFYPVVTAFRLSPVTFVGILALLSALVASLWASGSRRRRADWRIVGLFVYVALFTVVMTVSPKKLDRYLLPVYPVLVVLGALGLWLAIRRWLPGRLRWPAVAALGVCQVSLLASVAPYPLSFYNPLMGGATAARQTMIVGWGEGLDQVAAYLDRQPDARQIVAVSLYKDQIVPLYRGNGARLEDWRRGNYLVSYVNMEQRGLIPGPLQELVATTPPEHTVWINGIVYARVYRIPAELRERVGDEPDLRPNRVPNP